MRTRHATVAISVLLCGCLQKPGGGPPAAEAPTVEKVSTGAPADGKVELKILDFEGIGQLVASHRGHVVVMDAWSTSCPPCVKEFPKLVELHARYGPQRLACISLSFDYEGIGTPQEQAPHVRAFLERQQATFENVLSSDESDVLRRKFQLASVPAVFVYDKSGRLRKRFDNEHVRREADAFTYRQVGELVAELLDEDTTTRPDDAAEQDQASPGQ